jgi:hypothetical protein
MKDDDSIHLFFDKEGEYFDGHPSFETFHRIWPHARIEACVNSKTWGGWQWMVCIYND